MWDGPDLVILICVVFAAIVVVAPRLSADIEEESLDDPTSFPDRLA